MKADEAEKQSKSILLDYLKERAVIFEMRDRFITTRNKLMHIVNCATAHKQKERCRLNYLREAWQHIFDRMCEALGKEKKNKKKLEKLKMLPNSKRDEMLGIYYQRAKLRFRMKVYKDIMHSKGVAELGKDDTFLGMKNEIKALEKKLGFKKETEKAPKEANTPPTNKPQGKGP